MEWVIIILLIIFVIMVTLPIYDKKVTCNKNTTLADTYKESKDLVMLPNPNPAPLTTHITV